jgi:eukaryotic-like serine/threonine-protein kinase
MERPAPSVTEMAPVALDRVVKRCLAKDLDDRWQTARDLNAELVWIAGGGTELPLQAEARPAKKKNVLWVLVTGGLMAMAALAAWMLKSAPARAVSRTVISRGPDEHIANLNTTAVSISPDGANVVYVASRGGAPAQLFLRPLDALKAEPVEGPEGAAAPFFSPEGQWIAFLAGDKLKRISV